MTWNGLLGLAWSTYSVLLITAVAVWANYGLDAAGMATGWWWLLLPLFLFGFILVVGTILGEED